MKQISRFFRNLAMPAVLAGALLAAPAFAAQREGGARGGTPHSFSAGRSYSGGAHFEGGRAFEGRPDYGHGYTGGGAYFGFYGSPGYYVNPGACNPAGYYDQFGNWIPYPGCAVYPY